MSPESGSLLPEPLSVTDVPGSTPNWLGPASAVGASLTFDRVTVRFEESVSSPSLTWTVTSYLPSRSTSSGLSKSFAEVNASTPSAPSVNLPRSAPPAAPAGIDQVSSLAATFASVAVSVATAVRFSATESADALVICGA